MSLLPYPNRKAAGEKLATFLPTYRDREDVIVLGLPRGGIPVAYEVARALHARFDILVVRKIGLPGREELAMGAIASGGVVVRNEEVLSLGDVSNAEFERVQDIEHKELVRREQLYRGDHPLPDLKGQCVILVDDGLATGSTIRAAIALVREQEAGRVVVAVPVGPQDTVDALRQEADAVVCPAMPPFFQAIGLHYADFSQVSDDEVRVLLAKAWGKHSHESTP